MSSPSISMQGMWAILCHSFFLCIHIVNVGHSLIHRWEIEAGSPSSGMCFSSGQSMIPNCWREVRCWSPFLSNDLIFWNLTMLSCVRLVGSKSSSGKDSTSQQPPAILDNNNDVSLRKYMLFPLHVSSPSHGGGPHIYHLVKLNLAIQQLAKWLFCEWPIP